ncbi:hypothetical protein LCGC14_0434650 [marine sediment metagenome]|uniref:Primase C-terminal 2 domain-containing protein n=1 Tax=marine sediment metagenome TaxID=412755 RepID=A0A0F9VW96_9ZZZZ
MNKELDNLINKVNKSFPIYQLLGKMKKSIGWLPDEVVNRICQCYLKNSHKITKPWPWFVKATNESWRAYNAEKNISEGAALKKMPVPKELLELIRGVKI